MARAANALRSDAAAPVAAPLMLSRIGEELDDLAFLVARIESAVGRALAGTVEVDPENLRELQALDLVRQSLQDLARAARASAEGACAADLAAGMQLGQLRARLLGGAAEEASSGEVSLF